MNKLSKFATRAERLGWYLEKKGWDTQLGDTVCDACGQSRPLSKEQRTLLAELQAALKFALQEK